MALIGIASGGWPRGVGRRRVDVKHSNVTLIRYNPGQVSKGMDRVPDNEHKQVAAIDLGSNSFHMVVAWQVNHELRIQESLSEKVQLGAGLDSSNRITDEAQDRALECLRRFAQRIAGIPRGAVRVVGTNTLRVARNASQFLRRAEDILGHDIEIVAGREEARLIYLGVSHHLPDSDQRRLVVDIGGGSTELIIGERFESVETESLHMGCVSYTSRYFANGDIVEKQFNKAVTAARQEVLSIEANYRRLGWQQAIGASGTVKAIAQVCEDNGWSERGITLDGLQKIRKRLIKDGAVSALSLKGLREDRWVFFLPASPSCWVFSNSWISRAWTWQPVRCVKVCCMTCLVVSPTRMCASARSRR